MIKLLDGTIVDRGTIEIAGIDMEDYPKFCDAYVEYAEDENGNPLTEEQLNEIRDDYPEVVNEIIFFNVL